MGMNKATTTRQASLSTHCASGPSSPGPDQLLYILPGSGNAEQAIAGLAVEQRFGAIVAQALELAGLKIRRQEKRLLDALAAVSFQRFSQAVAQAVAADIVAKEVAGHGDCC
jgi:hypothetical protein